MATDYYEMLGVSRDADDEAIKRAYRRLARELHPDANPDDVAAHERFKEITVAYETLRDPEKRRRYDMFGAEGARAGGGGDPFGGADFGFGDIFDAFFGVRREIKVRAPVPCATCDGSGARPGTYPSRCSTCGGTGEVRRVRQSILGQMVTASPCPRCGGLGQEITDPCADCHGDGRRTEEKVYEVDVPPGVDDGTQLRLPGRGAAGPRGGPTGDLYLHTRVRPHPRFRRDGNDLVSEVKIAMTQAALGVQIPYETLDGTEELVVPAGTPHGKVFVLRGRGVPVTSGRGRGDLRVQVAVETPSSLSREQEDLLRQLAELRGEEVAPAEHGFLSRIKSAFK